MLPKEPPQRTQHCFAWQWDPQRASQVALVVKNLSANAGDIRDVGSILGSRGSFGNTLQYSNPGNSLDSYSPCGCKELDRTEVT